MPHYLMSEMITKPLSVLCLTKYPRNGASSRMRSFQYLPWLERAEIAITVAPFLTEKYVSDLQQGRKNKLEVIRAYFRRLRHIVVSRNYDLVWIEYEALPWLPVWVEQFLLSSRVPYVLDYDDAVFHYYDKHRSSWVRKFLGNKHDILMRRAAMVCVGNEYLADRARQTGAKQVEVIPTVVDLERYSVLNENKMVYEESGTPCVGWIGQRSTAAFLLPYVNLFELLAQEGVARFSAIGIDASAIGSTMESISWSEESEVENVASFDIGIMPLSDGLFERGKCGYKLIQYMACGLPVVASPVGVNSEIVEHGVNGFLAETPEEWEIALRALLSDPELRKRMGKAGREKVEQLYSLQVTGPRLAALLKSVTDSRNTL